MKIEHAPLQLESVVRRIEDDEIDLQPDFQRGEIWDSKRRQRLVDTILRGWYVPAVHIVVDTEGGEVVLDGQQRLAAIRDFFRDEIRIDGTINPPDDRVAELDGLVFSELPDEVKKSVKRFVLQVITLSDYKPQEPNELFFRLNQSYNLTPPEKRNALHGAARDQVKELVGELAADGLLDRQKIGFSNGRLAYDDIISRVCVALELGTLRRHINNKVVEEYYRTQEFPDALISGVRQAGRILLAQIGDRVDDRVKFNKGTLQTWLVYCYWAPGVTAALPTTLLHDFDEDRQKLRRDGVIDNRRRPPLVTEIVRIYDDRASYRVTDVSSVVARDLAIHLYSQTVHGTPPVNGSEELLARLASRAPTEVQGMFFEFLEKSQWGAHIVPE